MQAYYEGNDETVAAMFDRCGLVPSDEDKSALVSRLMSEGIASKNGHKLHHKKCLLDFLVWCKDNHLAMELCPFKIAF